VAGTEKGLGKEPEATFSTCFGAPFMALHPSVYAKMLGEKIAKHNVNCWLVNTGWSGGPYGVGQRMKIAYTRAMVRSALNGALAKVPTEPDPIFGLHLPASCDGVPSEVLKPWNTWKNPQAYQEKAMELAARFKNNFDQFAADVTEKIRSAGPRRT
ncbi:MAG: phosphoenolpyruvate carboxykinase (ATP), partial [Bacteroidota bacterium]